MNNDFWKNKKILLTGNTGFKGSWLSLWLKKLNTQVIGFSKSIPTQPSMFESANVNNVMTTVFADIRDQEKLSQTIEKFRPEIIIHMAAQSIVKKSYVEPHETYTTNVLGTLNLLESVRKTNFVRVVLNVTSDKCYKPLPLGRPFKEDDPLGGFDPYSSSKSCSELITTSYRKSFLILKILKIIKLH